MVTDNEMAYADVLQCAVLSHDARAIRLLTQHGPDAYYRVNIIPDDKSGYVTQAHRCIDIVQREAIIDGNKIRARVLNLGHFLLSWRDEHNTNATIKIVGFAQD